MKEEPWDIGGFENHVNYYVKQLLKNPIGATPDDYLKQHGWGNPKLLKALCDKGVVTKTERIKPNGIGKDQFQIQYHTNDNPELKVKELYNEKVKQSLNEDGEGGADGGSGALGGGATSAGFVGGEYDTPAFQSKKKKGKTDVISRSMPFSHTIIVNERQAQMLRGRLLDETTDASVSADASYDAPALSSKNPNFMKDVNDHSDIFKDGWRG